jgi:ABC-2 type transport system ATP-binding protein
VNALASYAGLVKRFGAVSAVDGLDFEVPEGSVCGLLGPNGAGKTTALCVLLGLQFATAGETRLLGERPGTPGFAGALRSVGALIENPGLYGNATSRQNLEIEAAALGLSVGRSQLDNVLRTVGLTEKADARAKTLSHGMKQRLGLGLTLMGGPRLVVLDEPLNGLDPAGIAEMRQVIKGLPERGTTVLLSSHLLSEVQVTCDRAAIVDDGRLVAEGGMQELLARYQGDGVTMGVDPAERDRAAELLAGHGLGVEPIGDSRLVVTGSGDGARLNRLLAEAGIYAAELRPAEASLEDVFFSLTEDRSAGEG